MKATCLLLLFGAIAVSDIDPPAEKDDLVGYWWSVEKPASEDAPEKVGVVSVTAGKGVYTIVWLSGTSVFHGAALRQGDKLFMAWNQEPKTLVLGCYEIKGSGKALTVHGPSERWVKMRTLETR